MPRVYHYESGHGLPKFPSRRDLLESTKMDGRLDELDKFLFHAFDVQNVNKYRMYNRRLEGYSVIVTGILEDGQRANLIIDQIPIYLDVRLSKRDTLCEKREIAKIINGSLTDSHEHWEVIKKYPGVGFLQDEVPYMRHYFNNQWDRKRALKAIRGSNVKYETASDVDGSLIQTLIIEYEWTFGDWSVITNFDSEYDEAMKIHNIFISDPNDFTAVSRPLSAEAPTCDVPRIPIYFHVPYDIEVNGTSDALPSVNNLDEKIFMLSGGVYRSDKPDTPLVSFTISHMKCMEDEYIRYMSSNERQEFMADDQPDWCLILTENERETLLAFADVLGKIQPEFRSHFNGYSFDDPYVVTRIHQYGKLRKFVEKLSIVDYYYTNFNNKEKDKNGNEMFKRVLLDTHIKLEAGVFDYNDNRRRLNYLGSINVDIMCAMKKLNTRDDLLTGHALKAYLDRYGLPKKIDMSIRDMNDYYKNNDGWGLLQSADYCTIDSLSCHRIANKVSLFQSYLTLAHLALCTPGDSALRAGGQKVKNVIYCFGKRMNLNYSEYTVPEKIEGKYPGAIVFPPIRGRYTEVPTIALDFSSLYPSIMRALWTSAETYIDIDKKPKLVERLIREGYDLFKFSPGWKFETEDGQKEINRNIAFVRKHPDGSECRGVYPKSLEFLTNIRAMYKRKMIKAMNNVARLEKIIDTEGENEEYSREMFEARLQEKDFNQKQLAVKIISNTIYGKIGSPSFNLFNPFIASTITLMGQRLITAASDVATDKGYKRLYGDSFTGDTPVIVRENNRIWITRVDEMIPTSLWTTREDCKQYFNFERLEIWEVDRFVRVNQIIRHKSLKKIVRVQTHSGLVDVTTDHSLYRKSGERLSPENIICGRTELLGTSFDNLMQEFRTNEYNYGITKGFAWMWGVFMSIGIACVVTRGRGVVYGHMWRIISRSKSLLQRCRNEVYFGATINPVEINGRVEAYCLECTEDADKIGAMYVRKFYNAYLDKIVPMEILYSSDEIGKAFLDGYRTAEGRTRGTGIEIRTDNKESLMGLILLIKKTGHVDYSMYRNRDRARGMYYLIYTATSRILDSPDAVVKKYERTVETESYVYDFNTETGKHHAGPGNIIVSNTDSIFLLPGVGMMNGETAPDKKVKICQALAEDELLPDILREIRSITKRDSNVVNMDLDKLLYPALLLGKKRYAGTIYEGSKKPHEYISGLEFIKRGKSQLLIELSKKIVSQVLDLDNNSEVKDMVLEVFKYGIDKIQQEPIEFFVKRAKYRVGKEGFISLFIERMKELALYDPTLYELPDPNEVFEYVVTDQEHSILHNGNQRKLKTSDKMEFKRTVCSSSFLKPDYMYYIEDVIGALARFICFHEEFNEDIELVSTEFDVIDKKSNEQAKKYLSQVLKDHMGVKKIKHTIIKRQVKRVNAEYSKQYGELVNILNQSFDKNIKPELMCQFIVNMCKDVPKIENVEGESNIKESIERTTNYIYSRKGKLVGVYSRYLNDIESASNDEIDDLEVFKKSNKISSSTKNICVNINDLKYFNGIDGNRSEDYIMDILMSVLN